MQTLAVNPPDRPASTCGDLRPAVRPVLAQGGAQDRDQLWDILRHHGCEPRDPSTAADGGERPMAAIISDEGADALATCARLSATCPVILISNRTDFAFRVATVRAGVQAVVRRPLDPTELSEWLSFLADREAPDSFSVLIVDDDWLTAEVNAEVLRSVGIKVTTVQDQQLALQAIEDAPPDLVLMDVQMPGIDGVELTRVIRQSRHLLSLPVIFLSAERDEARQFAARTLGGDDFIQKPVIPERLIRLVRLRADRSRTLRSLIERDRLTGLYDQTMFRERLTHELERCRRTGTELSVALVDVDLFKGVNDTYGHLMGDHVLRLLSGALQAGLRQIDIVGRCGGEEFGIVLLDTSPADAARAIDRIRQSFAAVDVKADGASFAVTFSAGVASSRDHDNQIGGLLAAADAALYRAKRGGRNAVLVAEPGDGAADQAEPHIASKEAPRAAA